VPTKWTTAGSVDCNAAGFCLSSYDSAQSVITFDYGRAEGGMPYLLVSKVTSSGEGPVEFDVVFSETFAGLQSATGEANITIKEMHS
jgi:hypothetical protein